MKTNETIKYNRATGETVESYDHLKSPCEHCGEEALYRMIKVADFDGKLIRAKEHCMMCDTVTQEYNAGRK